MPYTLQKQENCTSLKLTPNSANGSSVWRAAVERSAAIAARSISSPSCRGSALVSAGPVYLRRHQRCAEGGLCPCINYLLKVNMIGYRYLCCLCTGDDGAVQATHLLFTADTGEVEPTLTPGLRCISCAFSGGSSSCGHVRSSIIVASIRRAF